jgi:hypothetical protein
LLPARITRRKNIEFALEVLASRGGRVGRMPALLVTGLPACTTPATWLYLEQLPQLRGAWD